MTQLLGALLAIGFATAAFAGDSMLPPVPSGLHLPFPQRDTSYGRRHDRFQPVGRQDSYASRGRDDFCPPGLARRGRGCMPPGLARHRERNWRRWEDERRRGGERRNERIASY